MVVWKHEIRQNYKTLLIWSLVVGALTAIFMLMFKSLEGEISQMADAYANMGGFSAAFGMDKISFTTPMGFYGIEAGAMLSICGAMFGAMTGINMLSKEEHNHTAEFLLTHPVSRNKVILQKLLCTIFQVAVFNVICILFAVISFKMIEADIEWKKMMLFQLAQFLMHLEVACICFGISAFTRRQNTGAGLGFAAILYFMGIMYNISEGAESLKYITPFIYSDAGTIMSEETIDMVLVGIGLLIAMGCVAAAFLKYHRKDIAS